MQRSVLRVLIVSMLLVSTSFGLGSAVSSQNPCLAWMTDDPGVPVPPPIPPSSVQLAADPGVPVPPPIPPSSLM